MANAHLQLIAPSPVFGTVATPRRKPNVELRPREYLTEAEVERLRRAACAGNRNGHRDETMILIAFRHGLRAGELCDLQWHQVELAAGRLHVCRSKRGTPSVHPIQGDEIRALRWLQREQPPGPHVFTSERGTPFSKAGFAKMIARAGVAAGLGIKAHAHMLRHAAGYKLANDGADTRSLQAYLGHKNIQHTVKYTAMSPVRFRDFWRD